jgi:hypothetical protein
MILMIARPFLRSCTVLVPLRPTGQIQTEAISLSSAKHVQGEDGVASEREGGMSLVAHHSTLLRFGVSDRLEVRTVLEPVTMSSYGAPTIRGILPMEFGFKAGLWRSDDGASALSFIAHLQLPHLASAVFKRSRAAPLIRMTAATPLGENWRLGVTAGIEWDAGGGPAVAIYTAALGSSLTEDVGWYGEVYGFVSEDGTASDHRINGGVTWLANDDLQLDAALGLGLTTNPKPWFVGVGISYRFAFTK